MSNFIKNETGAVTVDWVVMTAALVGLGLAVMAVVSTGVQDTSGDIDDQLQGNDIITTAFDTDDAAASFAWMDYVPNGWTVDGYDGYRAAWGGSNNPDDHLRNTISSNLATMIGYVDGGQTINDAQVSTRADMIGAHMSILVERGADLPVTDPDVTQYMIDIGAIPSE